jgi:hypothetical protein
MGKGVGRVATAFPETIRQLRRKRSIIVKEPPVAFLPSLASLTPELFAKVFTNEDDWGGDGRRNTDKAKTSFACDKEMPPGRSDADSPDRSIASIRMSSSFARIDRLILPLFDRRRPRPRCHWQ